METVAILFLLLMLFVVFGAFRLAQMYHRDAHGYQPLPTPTIAPPPKPMPMPKATHSERAYRAICPHCVGTGAMGKYEVCAWCDGKGYRLVIPQPQPWR